MSGRRAAALLLAALSLPASAADDQLRLRLHESTTLPWPGALTAFAVDASMLDVRALDGALTLTARRPGQTVLTVVGADQVRTLVVRIDAPAAALAARNGAASGAGDWWASYESGTRRASSGANARFGDGARTGSVQFTVLHQGPGPDGAARWALPSASIALRQPGAELVLLDQRIEGAPLTLGGAVLRGAHLQTAHLELHAGVASSSPWNDLLLPRGGERALGLTLRAGGDALRVLPGLAWLPDSGAPRPGVATLGLEHGADGGPFHVKGELGWSGRPGAALDLSLQQPQRQVWLQAATRPAGFAALAVARPPGSYLDSAWSERLGARDSASLTVSANRLDLGLRHPQAGSARLEWRRQASAHWSTSASAGASSFADAGIAPVRRTSAAAGINYDSSAFGAGLLLRDQLASNASGHAHGARLTLRAAGAAWRASLYGDAQQQAPTLELVYQERPDLARAFTELGIVAASPEEVLRRLRDNAALLAGLGVSTGAFTLAPLRLQAGGELAWQDNGPRHARLGLHLMADQRRGIAGASRAALGSVSAAWRVGGDSELALGYARWSNRRPGSAGAAGGSLQVTLRTSLGKGMLSALALGGRAIGGRVLRDDGAGGQAPLAGIDVMLDQSRRTTTDRDGRFEFAAPGSGRHQVAAILPPVAGAYFTSPSSVQLDAGGDASFAISYAAARLSGAVRNDAGLPLAGVTVRLAGERAASAVTDSQGVYRFAAPAGAARVEIVAESVPPGYDLLALAPQERQLAAGVPALADFTLRAQRALRGVLRGAAAGATVSVPELGRTALADKDGNFVLRSLPAGPLTLVATGPGGEVRKAVTVPAEPGTVGNVELVLPAVHRR